MIGLVGLDLKTSKIPLTSPYPTYTIRCRRVCQHSIFGRFHRVFGGNEDKAFALILALNARRRVWSTKFLDLKKARHSLVVLTFSTTPLTTIVSGFPEQLPQLGFLKMVTVWGFPVLHHEQNFAMR